MRKKEKNVISFILRWLLPRFVKIRKKTGTHPVFEASSNLGVSGFFNREIWVYL